MKFTTTIIIALLCFISKSSFSQISKDNNNVLQSNFNTQQTAETIDITSIQNTSTPEVFCEKEWKKIQRQMKKSKKKIIKNKKIVHSTKILDTIFLEPSGSYKNSRLTEGY